MLKLDEKDAKKWYMLSVLLITGVIFTSVSVVSGGRILWEIITGTLGLVFLLMYVFTSQFYDYWIEGEKL